MTCFDCQEILLDCSCDTSLWRRILFQVSSLRHDGSKTFGWVDDHLLWYLQDNGHGREGQELLRQLYGMVQPGYEGKRVLLVPPKESSQAWLLNREGNLDDEAFEALRNALVEVDDTVVIRNTCPDSKMPWEKHIPLNLAGLAYYLWMHQAYTCCFATDVFDPCFDSDPRIVLHMDNDEQELYGSWLVRQYSVMYEKNR